MAIDFDKVIEQMSPFVKEHFHTKTFRHAGKTICDMAITNTSTDEEAREYAREMLEAFGFNPIPSDLPLACGHAREYATPSYRKEVGCIKCKREEERNRRKESRNENP